MLQAMSTGHDGSIATIHANSARECLGRLEMMMLLSGVSIPQRAMRQQIASAVNMIVHVSRLSDGTRKVMKISEISGMEGEMIMMQDLFEFDPHRYLRPTASIIGNFRSTGIRSAYAQRLETAGYKPDSRLIKTAARGTSQPDGFRSPLVPLWSCVIAIVWLQFSSRPDGQPPSDEPRWRGPVRRRNLRDSTKNDRRRRTRAGNFVANSTSSTCCKSWKRISGRRASTPASATCCWSCC